MNKNKSFVFLFILFICLLIPALTFSAPSAPAPTLLEVKYDVKASTPLVTGLNTEGTEILIYINGKYSGLADINETESVSNNFAFYIIGDLPVGKNQITAIARDKNSLLLSTPSAPLEYTIEPLSAPTLIAPSKDIITSNVRPLITGLSESNTIVHLVIDGVVNGNTGLITHKSGTANFAYKPFLNLSVGAHQVYAIAESVDGRKSKASQVLEFNIEAPMVAPSIFKPMVSAHPQIKGVAKNDSLIKVYIDHKLDGQFLVKNHKSGTASFSYTPFQDLNVAKHLIYLTASDDRGKESPWSNLIDYSSSVPKIAAGVDEVAVLSSEAIFGTDLEDLLLLASLFKTDKTVSVADYQLEALEDLILQKDDLGIGLTSLNDLENLWEAKRPKVDEKKIPEKTTEIPKTETKPVENNISSSTTTPDISEFINKIDKEEKQGGLINEDKKKQSNLRWNIAIFILFLLAVIVWIFWVNRELIKEQQEQDEKDKNDPLT